MSGPLVQSVAERWQVFETASLLAVDFDGTIALTSEPSPNGMTVPIACEHAIAEVFDDKQLAQYRGSGGLRNRAPEEIVSELVPDATKYERTELVRRFVSTKLSLMVDEIGNELPNGDIWPRLVPGFSEVWQAIEQTKVQNDYVVDTAVTSSGHTAFIGKVFEAHNLPQPGIFVTDDEIRDRPEPQALERRFKPSPLLIAMAHHAWLKKYGIGALEDYDFARIKASKQRILCVGDDANRDWDLAVNSGVAFELIKTDSPAYWHKVGSLLVPEFMH